MRNVRRWMRCEIAQVRGYVWMMAMLVVLSGACTPRVEVAAPDKPITINLNVKIDRRWFAQYTLFGYLAQFLQVPYANLFKNIPEEKLDDMLSAFQLKNCIENKTITKVLKKRL